MPLFVFVFRQSRPVDHPWLTLPLSRNRFLVLQLIWSCASVIIVCFQALFLHLEIRYARKISSESDLPSREMAQEVLHHMHRGFIVNWW